MLSCNSGSENFDKISLKKKMLMKGVSHDPPVLNTCKDKKSSFFFTDILAGFTFNNRVLRLPAIVLLIFAQKT